MLLASSNNDFIIEYENLEFGKTWFFEGNKLCLKYFKNNYFIFVINGEKNSEIQIYDKLNKFFVCNITDPKINSPFFIQKTNMKRHILMRKIQALINKSYQKLQENMLNLNIQKVIMRIR